MTRPVSTCVSCGHLAKLDMRGMCARCVSAAKEPMVKVDCFAFHPETVHNGQCTALEGNCPLAKGKPCSFHRTNAEYAESCARAAKRLESIPAEQRDSIRRVYTAPRDFSKEVRT